MKPLLTLAATAVTALFAQPAAALELNGGEVQLGYSTFPEETDLSRTALQGSVEIGFTQKFAAQLDLSHFNFDFANEDGQNVTLHAIYNVGPVVSVGAFYGMDKVADADLDFYGIEGGSQTQVFDTEAYLGYLDGDNDGTLVGLYGRFAVSENWGLSASYDLADIDGGSDVSRYAFTVDYRMAQGIELFGQVGSVEIGDDAEAYVGIGAKYRFGADGGVTFGRRGFLEQIPGL
ncbi:hypothetical protein [Actibacterium lipolyticum]|uniref:Porin n=1 Tax=Actibacterium lipolyticum TaxID=1524263 RepID=A0A238JMW2_9RHOB|nr:hypothetical protein [Actibacterium lipolyticum]SMX31773.1 hypothetical protein COL8621_00601 [Actibacterium lipolyticum]